MPEYLKANESPLNQAAKKAMKAAGVKPEPTLLFSLQAAKECVDQAILDVRGYLRENLEYQLAEWDPENARALLEGDESPEDELKENASLEDVGTLVIQLLEVRLAEIDPYFYP